MNTIKNFFLRFHVFKNIRLIYLDTESLYKTLFLYFKLRRIYSFIEDSKLNMAYDLADRLICSGYDLGHYYKAKILFLMGDDFKARQMIEQFLCRNERHANATYLLVDILFFLDERELAWEILERLLGCSKRKKTWQYLAKFVNDSEGFARYHELIIQYYPNFLKQPIYDLLVHYTAAAAQAKRQGEVISLWKLLYSCSKESIAKPKHSNSYTVDMASRALKDIKKSLDQGGIEFFLISGTLLGCIREDALLGHDKDIDLGVWDTVTSCELISAIRKSGCFYILPSSNENLVVVRHLNGVSIDLFIHYRTTMDYYHLGVKCIWHNSPFKLTKKLFLSEYYNVPKNYQCYLTENYGDWETPKIDFDSALDTPNMTVINDDMMIIYLYKKSINEDNIEKINKYINLINCFMNKV